MQTHKQVAVQHKHSIIRQLTESRAHTGVTKCAGRAHYGDPVHTMPQGKEK
eukprot:NODE_6617_length_317_cov_3.171642_g5459_i0.p3 GENE.NODE_6617_length_317_cov_3.171642_g5459_i0~~NODE_6617_length_317_cov_3.171642_g5459_i0.p3  ORF type:complete len:51 (-),score=6.54 NODE_6617_length_317_cov_3.171642_g5459_i0:70-222(-)